VAFKGKGPGSYTQNKANFKREEDFHNRQVGNAPWRKRTVKATNHEHIVKKRRKTMLPGWQLNLEDFGENEGRIGAVIGW